MAGERVLMLCYLNQEVHELTIVLKIVVNHSLLSKLSSTYVVNHIIKIYSDTSKWCVKEKKNNIYISATYHISDL